MVGSQDMDSQVRAIRQGINEGYKVASHPTIAHELLNSDLPIEEKSDSRLGDESQLVVAAGLVTTSWALTVGSFHIIQNPEVLRTLRQELASAGSTATKTLDWHKLEQLPYLNGCVHEAIRLSHGIATRSPRLAPDIELRYGEWVIPRNTPVSMTNVDILMNEAIFPKPKSFMPERWFNNPGLDRYFVPFGKGTRSCLGIK
jgi:cytochrome P450